MKRHRLFALSSLVLVASGALIFACSDSGNGNDAGPDSGGADAKQDTTVKSDASNDVTTNDVSTSDVTTSDASDASTSDVTTGDAGAVSTFMVLRVGGSDDAGADAALNNGSTQFFIEERDISDGSLVRTIDVPTTANGQNQPATMSGTSTSEGHLTTSLDGKYVVFTGFASAPGVASIASTSVFDGGVLRVVGRVDHAGSVDTTTRLLAFDRSDIRSAVTSDGTAFWASGSVGSIAADSGVDAAAYDLYGGIQYVTLGSTGATTNVTEVPFNTRVAGIFGNQLFLSSAVTPQNGVSSVGTGVPTTTGQATALLPGFPGDSGSPYGFFMLDQDASVSGLDVLYVADDASTQNGGGIQKWVFDGTTWTKIATFTNGNGFRALTAQVTSQGVVLLGTTTVSTVIKYLDDGVNLTPTGTVIATAPSNTAFRGIALAPQ